MFDLFFLDWIFFMSVVKMNNAGAGQRMELNSVRCEFEFQIQLFAGSIEMGAILRVQNS